jgi:hypothetical protein
MVRARCISVSRRGLMIGGAVYLAFERICWVRAEQGGGPTVVQIYAGTDWYRARPEPEKEMSGMLRARDGPAGPAARPALRYVLVTESEVIPVYAPQPSQLPSFVGQKVVIYGKLVNLVNEGFGNELWIGSVRPLTP